MNRCPACGHRRPNGTLTDLECHVLEALPVNVQCTLVRAHSRDLPPGTVRVTIEEPAPRMPSSEEGLFDPWGRLFAEIGYLRAHRGLALTAALLGLLLGLLVGFLAWGGAS